MPGTIAIILGTVLIAASAIWVILRVANASAGASRWPERVFVAGLALNVLFLVWRAVAKEAFPATDLSESLAFLAIGVGVGYLMISRAVKSCGMAAVLLPIAFVLTASSAFTTLVPKRHDLSFSIPFLALHATSLLAAYAALLVGSGASVAYLLQEHSLKRKSLGRISQSLPPLATLDSLSYRAIALAFPMLTFGLVLGSIRASTEWGSYWFWEPKLTLSLLLWLLGAAIFHLRTIEKYQGRRTALLTIASALMSVVVMLGPIFVPGGLHDFL